MDYTAEAVLITIIIAVVVGLYLWMSSKYNG